MKFKIKTNLIKQQMIAKDITKEVLRKSCKISAKQLYNLLDSSCYNKLMNIVKLSRFFKINIYNLLKI